jgi:hypothetical protein
MKCPKCGYTSFDYLDECKKCGADISDIRALLGVIAVSPDERAASRPSLSAHAAPQAAAFAAEPAAAAAIGGNFLGDEDSSDETFGDSFEGLVQPTSLGGTEEPPPAASKPAAKPAAGSSEVEPEEEFLDLDFGGIFEEEDKK